MAELTKKRNSTNHNLLGEAALGPARSGMSTRGLNRRKAIVDAAKNLLLEGGGLEFTLREVALRAEIRISNLQYYFPTRLAMLRAVAESTVEELLADLKRVLDSPAPPSEILHGLFERIFCDAKNAEISPLWWHFISLARIDPECSRLLDELYVTATRSTARVIRAANPNFTVKDSLQRAALLFAMTDGLAFQLGPARRSARGLAVEFLAALDSLLTVELPHVGKV